MLNPRERSRAFNFALKMQNIFSVVVGLSIIWSIYALVFTQIELIFISKVLLTLTCVGFGTLTPLIDFNESHATNPLWTGHARFHLVWQVNAMIITAVLSIALLWFFYSFSNHLIVILLNYLWIFSFYATVSGLKFFDGELNDINGVPPVFIKILGRKYEIDRNIQAITGSLFVVSFATALFLVKY